MSYKYTVLQDNPISFYMLDEVQSGSTSSYNVLMDQFATYQDLKDNGVSYSALTGLPIYDYSGNNNDGYAMGASRKNLMPIIAGGVRGTEILDTTNVHLIAPGLANKYYSDNAFSIEIWVKPPVVSIDKVSILGDSSNNIGLFWQNGDVIFQTGSYEVRQKVTNNKAHHVVGIFSGKSIGLYIDGALVDSLSIENFKFTNADIDFKIGPSTIDDVFIVDAVAFYRYSVSKEIVAKHYYAGIQEIPYSQIVYPDNGEIYSINHEKIRSQFRVGFPIIKPWSELSTSNTLLSSDGSYLTFSKTDTAGTAELSFEEQILIPSYLDIISSQLSYDDDVENITVEVRTPNNPWVICKNNAPLPYYNKNDNGFSELMFLRVTMTSSDTRTDLPKLRSVYIDMFANKNFYADNSANYISSDKDYSIARFNTRIMGYEKYSGLSMMNGGGFNLNTDKSARTVEMIFYPDGLANVLFSSNTKIFKWDSAGTITKSGVSSVYINGVDISNETNIFDSMSIGSPHHVVLVLSSAATSNIKFNVSQDGLEYGMANWYSNIAIYPTALSTQNILDHYMLYTDSFSNSVTMSDIQIAESSYLLNEANWTVTSFN